MKHLFKTSILRFVEIALVAAFIVVFMMPYTKSQAATVRLNASKKTLYYRSAGENIPDGKSAKEDKGFAQSYTLKLSGVDKSAAITWKSSNSKIAKVSSKGKVTAVSEGTATITASCGGKSYKCKVTVSKAGFSTGTETELTVGDKVKLKIKGDTVQKFKSSKRSVAKVTSAGNLTAKKAGKAVITAVCENGTYELTITVTASEKVAVVTPGPTPDPNVTKTTPEAARAQFEAYAQGLGWTVVDEDYTPGAYFAKLSKGDLRLVLTIAPTERTATGISVSLRMSHAVTWEEYFCNRAIYIEDCYSWINGY